MSYDLYFYKKTDNDLTANEIIDTIRKLITKNISEVDSQIHYENPRTGVYFLIDFNEPNTTPEDIDVFDSFDNFENLNINASINFFRPDYFGKEIYPIICDFSDKLDLYILNLQEFDDSRQKPLKWQAKELIDHWTLHNALASKKHFEEFGLNFMEKEKTDYLWSYTSQIDKLETEIKEDIYIPNAFVIKNSDSSELHTFIVWSESIPLILPKVDFVVLVKKFKKLFKNVDEIGIVKYKDILEKFAPAFDVYNSESKLLILTQVKSEKIKKDFNTYPIWRSLNNFSPQISLSGFVNNRP